jgi:hypothetical protein
MGWQKVGEHNVAVNVNGTQRVNENITDDTTYDIDEILSTGIRVNGSNQGTWNQSSDSNYDISVSEGSESWDFKKSWEEDPNGHNYPPGSDTWDINDTYTTGGLIHGSINNTEGYYSTKMYLQYNTGSGWSTWLSAGAGGSSESIKSFPSGTEFRVNFETHDRFRGYGYIEKASNGYWTDKLGNDHPRLGVDIDSVTKS